ncbi:unnamed protein product [Candidula unifasciata]|uniref:ceramide glucosyltransferase n=1 Tax=Candidula unifasciata TaxID=100452 RepID=A0A8S4A450_9EUPU|nr:unnamed protein product [Candidula unifasciata]
MWAENTDRVIYLGISFSSPKFTLKILFDTLCSGLHMWDVESPSDTLFYVLFVVASAALLTYLMMAFFIILSLIGSKMYLHKPTGIHELGDVVPGVSIIKPLMGVDSFLEHNLESHFKLMYPKFELLFCFHDENDEAILVVKRLQELYPHVDVTLFTGKRHDIVNPMVQNMAPAYEAAKYEYVWISSSRIEASSEILFDMASKLQKSNVALVHQVPFTSDNPGFASAVEKIYFGAAMNRFYICFNMLGLGCVTGMSYIFKKALLDQANGLAWYGRYLAEDFFLSRELHKKGRIVLSAFPAKQNMGQTTISKFVERMVRWLRLRLNMVTVVAGILEPIADCFPLGVWAGWALYHFFCMNPFIFFICHVLSWMVLDYIQLSTVQNGPLLFSKPEYVLAWIVRELTATCIFILGVINPHYIKWGARTYRVKLGGLVENVKPEDKTLLVTKYSSYKTSIL